MTVVTKAEIVIDNDVILNGEGNLTVDGNDDHRVFSVLEGVTASLDGFAVIRGFVTDSPIAGGILNDGKLTLTNSTVSDNARIGIANPGTLTLTNSTVSANASSGIYNTGRLTVTDSAMSDNEAGGINNAHAGTLTLTNSTVSANATVGIFNTGGPLTVTNSTVSDNAFGGIFSDGGPLTLTNSTVSGNGWSVNPYSGIFNSSSTVTLTNCTLSGNRRSVRNLTGTVTISSSILSGPDNCPRDVTSNGYNIESPGNSCGFNEAGDQSGVTAEELNLGPLVDNGGPTMTHLPGGGDFGDGSAAIDKIPETDCAVYTDQRGEPRPVVIVGPESCDVGSVEVQP